MFVQRKLENGTFQPVVATQADGKFTIPGLPRGPITLAASPGPGRPVGPEVTTEGGASDVVLVVAPAPR